VTAQLLEDLADQRRTAPFPQPVHDHCFQLTESSHPALPDNVQPAAHPHVYYHG
jgi:hypothetical protein